MEAGGNASGVACPTPCPALFAWMEGDLRFGKKLSCAIITKFDFYKAPLLIRAGYDY